MKYLTVLLTILFISTYAVQLDPQIQAVQGLIQRVLGQVFLYFIYYTQEYVSKFELQIQERIHPHRDFFRIHKTTQSDHIQIDGSTGVAISHGLYMQYLYTCFYNRYLKYYCKSSLSWGEDGTGDNIKIPNPLPEVSEDWFEEV